MLQQLRLTHLADDATQTSQPVNRRVPTRGACRWQAGLGWPRGAAVGLCARGESGRRRVQRPRSERALLRAQLDPELQRNKLEEMDDSTMMEAMMLHPLNGITKMCTDDTGTGLFQ